MLKAQILIDNIAGEGFFSEWGFCVYITYKGRNYLLDTGSSDKYVHNARKLEADLENVDFAVLSHAHFDHSGGYREFFSANEKASLYLSSECGENCYFKLGPIRKYIGIPKKLLADYESRLKPVSGLCELSDGVWLVPHIENELERIGKKAHLYRRQDKKVQPDNFSHELSLAFDTDKGLVLFNSCSHGGLQNILADVEHYLPGKKIYMTVGGLHLSKYSKSDVRKIANTIKELGISHVITGHCTGDSAFDVLKDILGDGVQQTFSGMTIEV